ncbi:hypothetical protein [Actinoplanes sp. NPDC051411]|uniref:hypothetical protein n=1 Tax=Actinoplanes sp. NPDC051411 TaxID=3155522 RepID=UPI00341E4C7C
MACRAAQAAGAATVAVLALAGCSAGQTAETSLLQTPVSGLNTASPDGGLQIRNLQVVYKDATGYPANGSAPLEVSLFNQTEQEITVTISSKPQQTVVPGIVSAQQVGLTGPAPTPSSPIASGPAAGGDTSPSTPTPGTSGEVSPPASAPSAMPSDTATPPPAAALSPAKLTIPALGSLSFLPGSPNSLIASGLSDRLAPGYSLALTVQSSTSATPIDVTAPVATPLSAGPRAPAVEGENSEGE